ncbi:MAG: hypothetical protein HY903_12220 [Deltaproteobacteria bacterium]|nr:hypothetical protein [Deltaproteobacteria bacterium]
MRDTDATGADGDAHSPVIVAPTPFGLSDYRTCLLDTNVVATHLATLGVQHIRLAGPDAVYWDAVDTDKDGVADAIGLARVDGAVRDTASHGKPITMIIALNALPGGLFPGEGTATRAAYVQFVQSMVERYDGDGTGDLAGSPKIAVWQIGNEPNAGGGPSVFLPTEFAKQVLVTADAVLAADPTAKLALGGTFGADQGTGQGGLTWQQYYTNALAALAASAPDRRFFDYVDVHVYGDASGDYELVEGGVSSFRSLLAPYPQYADVRVIFTEVGTSSGGGSGPTCPPYQSEVQEAADLVKRYTVAIASGAAELYWFRLCEHSGGFNPYFDLVGLIFDGTDVCGGEHDRGANARKLTYFSFASLSAMLAGASTARRVLPTTSALHLRAYRFTRAAAADVVIVWWDTFADGAAFTEQRSLALSDLGLIEAEVTSVTSLVTSTSGAPRTVTPSAGAIMMDGEPLAVILGG